MLQEPTLAISPTARADVKLVGKEKTPVLIIDNYGLDCAPILQHAYGQSYHFAVAISQA